MPRKKSQPRRRVKAGINLLSVAEGVITANAVTSGLFGTNAWTFLTDGWFGTKTKLSDSSWEVSLSELLMDPVQGRDVSNPRWNTLNKVMQYNLENNGRMMIATVVGAPIVFRFMKRSLRGILTPTRRLLKGTGVTV